MYVRQHPAAIDALSAIPVVAALLWIATGCCPHSPTPYAPSAQRPTDSFSDRTSIKTTEKATRDAVIADAEESLSSPCEVEPEPGRPFEPEIVVRGLTGEITEFRYHSGMLAWIENRRVLAKAELFGTRKVLSSPNSGVDSLSLNRSHLYWVGGRPWMEDPARKVRAVGTGHWELDRATGEIEQAPGQGVCLVADDDALYTTLPYPDRPNQGDLVRFSLTDMNKTVLLPDVPLNVYCHLGPRHVILYDPGRTKFVPKDGGPVIESTEEEQKHYECQIVDGQWFFEIPSVTFSPLKVPVDKCFLIDSVAYAPDTTYFLVGDSQPLDLPPGSVSTPPAPDKILKISRRCAAPPIVIARLRKPIRGRIVYGDGYVYWGEDGAIWRTPG